MSVRIRPGLGPILQTAVACSISGALIGIPIGFGLALLLL